ncbi:sensor histidine kinase [Sphingomonas sp.]|uniref:sensor histidine kinase n=1 Tax=Sphingomonas sp. TaxID=28214 RepID=UPI003B3A14CD
MARDRPLLGLAATIVIVAIAWVVRTIASPSLPPGFPYVTFFPAVIITSFLFGIRLGTVAAAACGLLAWYFFIPPYHSFALSGATGFALAFYLFVVATDLALVHWMQTANGQLARERELSQSLAATRELLFRELQHRISNNLQVAAGLLTMQKRRLTDPTARAALDEASNRIALVGRISRQLYDPSGSAQPLLPFLESLCRDVVEASGRRDLGLRLAGNDRLLLQPDAAVPTALIVAEAVANAIEHGFADGRSGQIVVTVTGDDQTGLSVTIDDDGHGLPEGFEATQGTSLGLQIATNLAKGQGGRFELECRDGTRAALRLPPHLLETASDEPDGKPPGAAPAPPIVAEA